MPLLSNPSGFGLLLRRLLQADPSLAEELASVQPGTPQYGDVEASRLPAPTSVLATAETALGGYGPGTIGDMVETGTGSWSPSLGMLRSGRGLEGFPLSPMSPSPGGPPPLAGPGGGPGGSPGLGIIQRLLWEIDRMEREQAQRSADQAARDTKSRSVERPTLTISEPITPETWTV
jgi:hypothetical protein